MSGYSQEILDSLTDEEREALLDDDGGDAEKGGSDDDTGGADDNGAGNDKGGNDGKGEQGDKGGADSKAAGADNGDATGADDAGKVAGAGDGGGDDDGKQPAAGAGDGAATVVPLLVAEAPADADAKLKDISDKKAALLDQFDNGDITAKEYQTQLDALNKDERGIERAVEKAQLAAEMKQQQEMGSWLKQVGEFTTNDHPEYSKSRSRWMALDTFVKEIASKPENANLDGREILRQAHERVVEDLGEAPKAATKKDDPPAKPLKGSKIEPPKTLGKVPASDNAEIEDGKFAALDRLADTDPLALEEKLMKMSATDRDEYLASRG